MFPRKHESESKQNEAAGIVEKDPEAVIVHAFRLSRTSVKHPPPHSISQTLDDLRLESKPEADHSKVHVGRHRAACMIRIMSDRVDAGSHCSRALLVVVSSSRRHCVGHGSKTTSMAALEAPPDPPPAPPHSFVRPRRAITCAQDLKAFRDSPTYGELRRFVRLCSDAVRGKRMSDDMPVSDACSKLVAMLTTLKGWVDEIPPLQQPMRFGNKAFRTWHNRLVTEARGLVGALLPAAKSPAVVGPII